MDDYRKILYGLLMMEEDPLRATAEMMDEPRPHRSGRRPREGGAVQWMPDCMISSFWHRMKTDSVQISLH
jgi:hypothetical protein